MGLIDLFPNLTGTCDLQHGFKKTRIYCHTAAYTVKETISLYTSNYKSRLFMCSLDANKAFDSVWWDGLFVKLKPMLPSKIWILFLYNFFLSFVHFSNVARKCTWLCCYVWGSKTRWYTIAASVYFLRVTSSYAVKKQWFFLALVSGFHSLAQCICWWYHPA
jgi:hypothetical protein